jgi:hypothetical protein
VKGRGLSHAGEIKFRNSDLFPSIIPDLHDVQSASLEHALRIPSHHPRQRTGWEGPEYEGPIWESLFS